MNVWGIDTFPKCSRCDRYGSHECRRDVKVGIGTRLVKWRVCQWHIGTMKKLFTDVRIFRPRCGGWEIVHPRP